MRTRLLMFVAALGFVAYATTPIATGAPAAGTDSNQTVVWKPRELRVLFPTQGYSCEYLYDDIKSMLLQLGARKSDLNITVDDCSRNKRASDDPNFFELGHAKFWVLTPADTTGENAPDALLQGRWQTIQIRLDQVPRGEQVNGSRLDRTIDPTRQQYLIQMLKEEILPLFPTKDIQFYRNESLRLQILKPLH
jgi:hypothetical protein